MLLIFSGIEDSPDSHNDPELFERCVKFTKIQKHVTNIEMKNVVFIMRNSLQTIPSLENQYLKPAVHKKKTMLEKFNTYIKPGLNPSKRFFYDTVKYQIDL